MSTGIFSTVLRAVLPGLILSASANPAPAFAEGETLELGALLEIAGSSNPAILAGRLRADAAARDLAARSAMPDPRVFVAALNDGYDPSLGSSTDSFIEVGWEQDVPAPGRRKAALTEGERMAELARRGAETLQVRLRERIIRLFADIWLIDRTIELQRDSRDLLETLASSARVRYESGEGHQESILRAQLESQELAVEIRHLERERRAAQYALATAIGRPEESLSGATGSLPLLDLPLPDALPYAAATSGEPEEAAQEPRSAEVAEAAAALRVSEAAYDRAVADRRPDWSWQASYQNRGGLDPMFAGGVAVALPLWHRRKQDLMVARAGIEREAARMDLEAARQAARAGAMDWLDEALHSQELAGRYETELVPQARSLQDAARVAYESGQSEFILILQDLRSALSVRIGEARERSHLVQAAASLEAAMGRPVVITTPGGRRS